MPRPHDYTAIKDAGLAVGQRVNLMGIITSITEPQRSRGDDWVLHFFMRDDNFTMTSGFNPSEIRCKLFRRDKSKLPTGCAGDPVLIRDVKVTEFNNRIEVISSSRDSAQVLIFEAGEVPASESSSSFGRGRQPKLHYSGTYCAIAPSPTEQLAISQLKAAAAPSTESFKQSASRLSFESAFRDKRALIKDVSPGQYFDLRGEVVKAWDNGYATTDLYISDYTSNSALYHYEDPALTEDSGFFSANRSWKGPYGQVTMQVRLYGPDATYARANVAEGDVVALRNVRVKLSPENKLEGTLHEDLKNPDKLQVSKLRYEREYEELLARKKAHLAKTDQERERELYARANPGQPKKASAKASAKKKEEKKERQRQKKLQEQHELERQYNESTLVRAGINPTIKASNPDKQNSTVDEILNNPLRKSKLADGTELALPFTNAKYRTQLRVVDFHPDNLEDFARSMSDPDWNTALQDPDMNRRRDDRWKWAFVLLVEEAGAKAGTNPQRFPVFVNNKAAQYLLKMDATDLRNDGQGRTLKKMEEKLFHLWGNLLELKRELVSNTAEPSTSPAQETFTTQSLKRKQSDKSTSPPDYPQKRAKLDTPPLPCGDERLDNRPFECCIVEYAAHVPISEDWPDGYQRMYMLDSTTIHA